MKRTMKAAILALMLCFTSSFPALAGKVLHVGIAAFPDNLSTSLSSYAARNLLFQMYEGLVARGNDSHIQPALAERWEALSPTHWRFYLRENVTFHDGTPFTAEDVKDTFDYILGDNLYGIKSRVDQLEIVEVVDARTVDFKTRAPFPTLLIALTEIPIESKTYMDKVGREGAQKRPVGTGPFEYVRWVPGDMLELRAFKDYWNGKPHIGSVIMRQIPEGSTRVASLLAGETQIIEEVPMDLIDAVKRSAKAEIASVESTVGLIFTYDTRKPPFDNPKVREALNYAVNKELILDKLLYGNGTVLQGQPITSNTFGFNPRLQAYPYNPEKARAMLKEAGYPNGFSTSITTRSGKYLSDVDICNVVAGNLREVGINATVNVVEGGVFSKMIKAEDLGPMHIVGWYSIGDADFATVWFTQGSKRAFWKNDEYERLFVEARSTVDQDARLKAYNRMMEIFHEENPALSLFGLPSVYGKSKRLTNWVAPADKFLQLSKAKLD